MIFKKNKRNTAVEVSPKQKDSRIVFTENPRVKIKPTKPKDKK